ncbi:hypothetical protein KTU01_33350 [Kocuria turfanensis]|uniref:DUF305 domain-containing protein n=1 Tax=Kocuria turfanensis TaxID=388357 RepID=A0A512IHN2_9MICC|nr:hypothetical protein KTU01_33350 [Kocuria turfanensis]
MGLKEQSVISGKRRLRRRVPAAAASAVLALGAVTGTGVATAAPAFADAPAGNEQAASFEVEFLKSMIDHHYMAVVMAQECVDKAVHPELAAMCEDIITVQNQEIEQMQTWLQEWYGITYEPQLSTGDMASMQRLDQFTGAEYEIRFMQSMIRHHWAAVREAETCLDRAEHQDLLQLCQNIKTVQLSEIAQMQTWLEEWYDRQGGRPAATA